MKAAVVGRQVRVSAGRKADGLFPDSGKCKCRPDIRNHLKNNAIVAAAPPASAEDKS